MSTVILQLAVSIDGYIARKDGSVDYLEEFSEELTTHFNQFLSRIDVIIMGSNTYEVMLGFGDVPFTDKQIYVLTNRTFPKTYSHVHFTTETVPEILERVQGTIWLFGGAKLIQTCINLDIIDEYQLPSSVIINKVDGVGG